MTLMLHKLLVKETCCVYDFSCAHRMKRLFALYSTALLEVYGRTHGTVVLFSSIYGHRVLNSSIVWKGEGTTR